MTRMKFLGFFAALLILASPVSALTQQEFEKLSAAAFEPVIKRYDIPGMAIGVTMGGRHYVYTYGKASRESGAAVTGDTIFELGSISKTFTATLAAQAVGRGLLVLDHPASDYLPALKGSAFDRISLIDLATHTTGGLPVQVPDGIKDEDELLKWLVQWQPREGAGPVRSYSNISIGLLGKITARAMGMSFRNAAQNELFPALGLKSTWIDVPASEEGRYAYGYAFKEDKPIRVTRGVLDAEAYGVKSTVEDMLRFLEINLGDGKASGELREAIAMTHMGRTETAYFTQDMIWEQYPWPVTIDRLRAGNSMAMIMKSQPVKILSVPIPPRRDVLIDKTGSTSGFSSYVAILPAEHTAVVTLANRDYPIKARVEATYGLMEMLLKHKD
jgi:beta-lactamase class C